MSDTHLSRRAMLSGAAIAAAGAAAGAAAATQVSAQAGDQSAPMRPGEGKAAIVTGSSRGIGAAIARRLARDGYAVTVRKRSAGWTSSSTTPASCVSPRSRK